MGVCAGVRLGGFGSGCEWVDRCSVGWVSMGVSMGGYAAGWVWAGCVGGSGCAVGCVGGSGCAAG